MRLPIDKSYMKHTKIVVRAFDDIRREVIEEIEIEVQIGPCMFNTEFQVMDILPSYNCLLGRCKTLEFMKLNMVSKIKV